MNVRDGALYRFAHFTLDTRDERLLGPAGPIKLGNKAFRVLLNLIRAEGRLVTKDTLFETVWDGTLVSESSLTSVIKELRRALGDDARAPKFIESAYGRGYRFLGQPSSTSLSPETAPEPHGARRSQSGHVPVLLVTKFDDSAIAHTHSWLGMALREEVLSGLARFSEIQLVSDDRPEREAIAARRSLGARDYQLGALLLPSGNGVKLIARAKRLSDGHIVWAESMPLSGLGVAGDVEHIVRRIIGAAFPAVDNDISLGLPEVTSDLYDRYLLARGQALAPRTFSEARAAADALESIIAERPGLGLAYPPLVRLYNIDYAWTALGSTGPEELDRALHLAKAGLAADRENAHAHVVLGFCYLRSGEPDAAHRCLETALALNPHNTLRLREVATGLAYLGLFDQAERLFELSRDLQPVPDDQYLEDRCQLALLQGRLDEASAFSRQIGEQRLWSSLYEALSLLGSNRRTAIAKLSQWRKRVERDWHRPGPVEDEQLIRWIGLHHPLLPEPRGSFLSLINEALAEIR